MRLITRSVHGGVSSQIERQRTGYAHYLPSIRYLDTASQRYRLMSISKCHFQQPSSQTLLAFSPPRTTLIPCGLVGSITLNCEQVISGLAHSYWCHRSRDRQVKIGQELARPAEATSWRVVGWSGASLSPSRPIHRRTIKTGEQEDVCANLTYLYNFNNTGMLTSLPLVTTPPPDAAHSTL